MHDEISTRLDPWLAPEQSIGHMGAIQGRFMRATWNFPFWGQIGRVISIAAISTVAAYLGEFEELLNEVTDQTEESLISFFIGGLKPELRSELRISQPSTLRKMIAIAKVHEAKLKGAGKPFKGERAAFENLDGDP